MAQTAVLLLLLLLGWAGTAASEDWLLSNGSIPFARGGTEAMRDGLLSRLEPRHLAKYNFVMSRVRELPEGKSHVLWLHDLPEDPESHHLQHPQSRARFWRLVFVSEWQFARYAERYGIQRSEAAVLKNAIVPLPAVAKPRAGALRLIYHTTPHRGLHLLIPVFGELRKRYGAAIELDVYSSFRIYGPAFAQRDKAFEEVYEACRRLPGCRYHGTVSNDEVRAALLKAHVFAYPSVWSETSCLAAMEAMSAGCAVVASDLGALPETLSGFATMYQHTADPAQHMLQFMRVLDGVIATYWDEGRQAKLQQQKRFADEAYGWDSRIVEWRDLLDSQEQRASDKQLPEMKLGTVSAAEQYKRALALAPFNSTVLVQLGMLEVATDVEQAVWRFELALSNKAEPSISYNSAQGYDLVARIGWYRASRHQYELAAEWLAKAIASKAAPNDCWDVFRSTLVPHIPLSRGEARSFVRQYRTDAERLLSKPKLTIDRTGCFSSGFPLAYYETADRRSLLENWVALHVKVIPGLLSVSPHLQQLRVKATRRLRVGFLSSFFTPQSSIWGSFGETIRRLPSEGIEVVLIYYPRSPITPASKQLSPTPENNIYLAGFGPTLQGLQEARVAIAQADLDVLVYLDLWMTPELHQLALSRLAPVQACTHGHPVTSAIPRSVMHYYISWAAAELPAEQAQAHYTEELVLLPASVVWEYWEPRNTPDEHSTMAEPGASSWGHYTRETLDFLPSDEARRRLLRHGATWYFCAQASFKFDFSFDEILASIQRADPSAVLILVQMVGDLEHLHARLEKRLLDSGVDTSRVVFIPRMAHPQLMALYKLTDVVLDSVNFGGDTTTREAFETGAPVVTLPRRLVGERWTQAYYNVMGVRELIAKDEADYVRIAVSIARDNAASQALRARIKAGSRRLFRSAGAAPAWADMLRDIASRGRAARQPRLDEL